MKERAVVIVSGGMDSVTALHDAVHSGYDTFALSINYNQRHKKELECAAWNCKLLNVPHKIIDLSQVGKELLQGSSLTSDIDVPEGHYEAETMKSTVVANRNMILLSLGLGYAISIGAKRLVYGAHAGDHAIYPDCRPEFVEAMQKVAALCDWSVVELSAPYIKMDKGDIVSRGISLGMLVMPAYKNTWTCYKGKDKACGVCGSCSERILAFNKAGEIDPVEYEDSWEVVLKRAKNMLNTKV